MRQFFSIFLIYGFLTHLNLFSQDINEKYYDIDDHSACSHRYLFEKESKSVINPSPLLFEYDVKFYKLDIEAYDTTNQFSGNAVISAEVIVAEMDTFLVELTYKLVVDSVFLNDVKRTYTHTSNKLIIPLPSPALQSETLNLQCFYHTPSNYLSKFYSATTAPTYGNFTVSQSLSEPYGMYHWMPCKQELEDKADSVHIFITTDSSLKVAGPGLLTEVPLPNGKVRFEWRTNQKTAYYLIAFAISDYQEYSIYAKPDSLLNDSIWVLNYVYDYPNCLESNIYSIDQTTEMIEFFSNRYGLYPFYQEKYGHYMWYPTSFSGMEHITMSGMRYFSLDLVSHELGHSWFGDNVTCATWSDIWVNEGFASYSQYIARQLLSSQSSANGLMNSYHNTVMSAPDGSVYVPESDLSSTARVFSTRLTYRKGAALVHMIRYEMDNDSLFFKTLYDYQQFYKDSVATGLDFKNICEDISGMDFNDFFDQWYFGEGYPIFDVQWWQAGDTVFVRPIQTTSTEITPLFKTPIEFKYSFNGSDQVTRFDLNSNDTVFKTIVPYEVVSLTVDPDNWILNQTNSIAHLKNLDVRIYLGGTFNAASEELNTYLNPSFLPLEQPFNQAPWNHSGTESVNSIPNVDIVDWILIELRDTTQAELATTESIVERIAAFLLNDGSIVSLDGISFPQFTYEIANDLYVVIHHRNHLSIMSAIPLQYSDGIYSYNFTSSSEKVHNGASAYIELATGIWGMMPGDADASGLIDNNDKTVSWEQTAGEKGYLNADLNLDTETNNIDKDDFWFPNSGEGTQIPE